MSDHTVNNPYGLSAVARNLETVDSVRAPDGSMHHVLEPGMVMRAVIGNRPDKLEWAPLTLCGREPDHHEGWSMLADRDDDGATCRSCLDAWTVLADGFDRLKPPDPNRDREIMEGNYEPT